MLEPLPNNEASGGWYTADVITPEDVYAAIAEAEQKTDKAKRCYDKHVENSSDYDFGDDDFDHEFSMHEYAIHESSAERDAASLARIQAVLLTAIYIEGAVNAWGVFVAGEVFFKAHIERCKLESKIAIMCLGRFIARKYS